MFSSTVLFSIKLTGTFMNLEFSTINYNTNKCRIHLHSGRENQTAYAYTCSSIGNIEQVGCTSFF